MSRTFFTITHMVLWDSFTSHSVTQSCSHLITQCIKYSASHSVTQNIELLIQSHSYCITQLLNYSVIISVTQSLTQLLSHSVTISFNYSVSVSVIQSVLHYSVTQLLIQLASKLFIFPHSGNQLVSYSTTPSINY